MMGEEVSDLERQLWDIFSFYTLNGNPLEPQFMQSQQFIKFVRHCGCLETTNAVSEADCNIIYTTEVTSRAKRGLAEGIRRGPGDLKKLKMTFSDFLNACMKLSMRIYPECAADEEVCFEKFITEQMPNASQRTPVDISPILGHKDIKGLFRLFRDGLNDIVGFYGSMLNEDERKQRNSLAKKCGKTISYSQFLKMMSDFDLSGSVQLSAVEIGDIFLSSMKLAPSDDLGKLSIDELWESLIRCALTSYARSKVSVLHKIKALLIHIAQAVDGKKIAQRANKGEDSNLNFSLLLSGTKAIQKIATDMWIKDGRNDYLSAPVRVLKSGRSIVKRLGRKNAAIARHHEETKPDMAEMVSSDHDWRQFVTATCPVPGCNNPVKGSGYCSKHADQASKRPMSSRMSVSSNFSNLSGPSNNSGRAKTSRPLSMRGTMACDAAPLVMTMKGVEEMDLRELTHAPPPERRGNLWHKKNKPEPVADIPLEAMDPYAFLAEDSAPQTSDLRKVKSFAVGPSRPFSIGSL
eukprot:TRINITY_DN774087_c0_g1_i1.p1 TRINITY_DN774087_c0_g1~~TRINITY_DN774087_c0_g1_i1.p1  ORF type:complete len:520 (+),score=143.44 TRINITY_DN774087_c0_g1_i1:109-1668(+)